MKYSEIDLKLRDLVRSERRITAEIISVINDIDRQKLFLDLGHSSLFSYLTQGIGYSASAAQRRIEAARILRHVPEIGEKLRTGVLNLTSLALTAQAIRHKEKTEKVTTDAKKELVALIENKNTPETQVILARALDLPVMDYEKAKFQRDESLRLELTLNKVQREKLQKVKALSSHAMPASSWSELFEYLADFYLNKKGVSAKNQTEVVSKCTSVAAVKSRVVKFAAAVNVNVNTEKTVKAAPAAGSRYVSQSVRKIVFRRDECCQWREPKTQKICGSKHQLEIHHQKPFWAGGAANENNLQLLCRAHNAYTYRSEANIRIL